MEKNRLMRQIWSEKRGKVVRDDVSDLGVSITVDTIDFHWHHVIYGLLSLLLSDPEKAYEWSKNWGRTVIQVHPRRGFAFKFSSLQSDDEKAGVFLSTSKKIRPEEFINDHFNKGRFTLMLNSSDPLLLEGAILQVERMVDELVWCYHNELLLMKKDGDAMETYESALRKVWEGGVIIRYDSEDNILCLRRNNPKVPIRIYGDILGSSKVPKVIGAVIIPAEFTDARPDISPARISALKDFSMRQSLKFNSLPIKEVKRVQLKKVAVCSAVTVGKRMHAGHLFLLAYASLINRAFGARAGVHLELNDVGERIYGVIAATSRELNVSVELAIEKLMNDQNLSMDFVDYCYRNREMTGMRYLKAMEILSNNPLNLFERFIKLILDTLKRCGFDSVVEVRDSECVQNVANIYQLSTSDLSDLGFRFVKYQEKNQKKMCILEKGGSPTASTMRAAFLHKVSSANGFDSQMVFVDAGPDVTDAVRLLKLSAGTDAHQFEGIGLSFDMKIVSGSNGLGISIEDFHQKASEAFSAKYSHKELSSDLFSQMLTFFILTRDMTAKSHRCSYMAKVDKTGISFFDYQREEVLINDFVGSCGELIQFLFDIEKAKQKMLKGEYQNGEKLKCANLNTKLRKLVSRMRDISSPKNLSQIFPPQKAVQINWPFNLIRNWLSQNCEFSMSLIDDLIIQSSVDGCHDLKTLREYLCDSGLSVIADMPEGILGSCGDFVELNFVSSLQARGYSRSQTKILAKEYMQGNFCLVRKRSIYFDTLLKFLSSAEFVGGIDRSDVDTVVYSIDFCLEKNGLLAMGHF